MEENSVSWKIIHSLWIIISFIPFLNGFSFLWIGTRVDEKKWLYEGALYELLVIIIILSISFKINSTISSFLILIWIITWIICIVRSFYVRNDYLTYLKAINSINIHEDTKWEIIHSLWFLFSFILFLNGLGFIWIGFHAKKSKWLYEGLLYEAMFIVFIFLGSQNLSDVGFNIYFITWFISILRSFWVRNDYLNILRERNKDNNNLNTTAKKLDLDTNTHNNEYAENIKNNEYQITSKKLDLDTNTSNEYSKNSKEDKNKLSDNDLDENDKNNVDEGSNSRKLDF